MEKEAIQNKEKNFVSCVLYLHNDGKNIREFLKTVCGTMEQNFEKYEIKNSITGTSMYYNESTEKIYADYEVYFDEI